MALMRRAGAEKCLHWRHFCNTLISQHKMHVQCQKYANFGAMAPRLFASARLADPAARPELRGLPNISQFCWVTPRLQSCLYIHTVHA